MAWQVLFHSEFYEEFLELDVEVQDEIAALTELLAAAGPALRRPLADTLNGSHYANMKELRFSASNGVWRLAYAFAPDRDAILLVAGDKSGTSQKLFYKRLIAKADQRYAAHLAQLKKDKLK
jgi:hypothetical protein